MDPKERAIHSMIREDYDFPLLQELFAELIYETRGFNSDDLQKRMNGLLYQILGSPARPVSYEGNHDDSHDLFRIIAIHKRYLNPGEKQLTLGEAAAFVARQKFIAGHQLGDTVPNNLSDLQIANIRAYQKRLKSKIKKVDFKDITRQGLDQFYEAEAHAATIRHQIEFLANLIPEWISRYLAHYFGQCTFVKKTQKK